MNATKQPIPFQLDAAGLGQAKVFLAHYSSKTGAGKEQIEILGDGTVHLITSKNYEAPEQVTLGKIAPNRFATLLAMMEAEKFLGLEEEYGSHGHSGRKHIRLTLPSEEKSVYVDQGESCPAFDRIWGAIKTAAGLGTPLALKHRLFFRL
jgi:hypothetical protein